MELFLLETNLNLRIEKRKSNTDYSHNPDVARAQKAISSKDFGVINPDIIINVEDMKCEDKKYKNELSTYKYIEALDDFQKRGVSCFVKDKYDVLKIASMTSPHMLHVRIKLGEGKMDYLNIIAFRLLVSDSSISDFQDRKKQFDRVMKYIDFLEDTQNLVLTGDWNHGVISQSGSYPSGCSRHYFNYQYIVQELQKKCIKLTYISDYSYKNYMKIDHLAVSQNIYVEAQYKNLFENSHLQIGIPDHKSIIAKLKLQL